MSRMWSGKRAKAARLAAGFDRPADAADAIGVHMASIYAWEAGREPQLRHASALADAYDIKLDSLFVVHDGPNGNCPKADVGKTHEPDAAAGKSSPGLARTGA